MRTWAVGVAIVSVMAAACASTATTTPIASGASSVPAPTISSTPTAIPAPARTTVAVTVGGIAVTVSCQGEAAGRPTIVLMHGNGAGGQQQFRLVEPDLAKLSRVCQYSRPGTGDTQAPADLPRPVTEVVTEVHEILDQAGIGSPVFLLGSSEGGVIAFMYAQAYPSEVAGFVSINPNPPYEQWIAAVSKVETPDEVTTLEQPDYRGENPERIDNRPNSSMLTLPLPGSIPYAMMFDEDCGGDNAFCAKVFEPLRAITERLAKVGPGGRFVAVPGAGHTIEQSNPREVSRVVAEVWAEATP